MDNTIGNRIRLLREERGMLQQDLADCMKEQYGLNTNRVTISKWENGKQMPETYSIRVLAQIFGVTMEYIAGIVDGRNEKKRQGLIASAYTDYDVFYDQSVFENEADLWRLLHSRVDKNNAVHEINVLIKDCNDEQLDKIVAMIKLMR